MHVEQASVHVVLVLGHTLGLGNNSDVEVLRGVALLGVHIPGVVLGLAVHHLLQHEVGADESQVVFIEGRVSKLGNEKLSLGGFNLIICEIRLSSGGRNNTVNDLSSGVTGLEVIGGESEAVSSFFN